MSANKNNSAKNFSYSLKKYVIDNLVTIEGLEVYFDKTYIEGQEVPATKTTEWVVFDMDTSTTWGVLKNQMVYVYIHARGDKEGDKLNALQDAVIKYFEDMSVPDGQVRVPLYDTSQATPWPELGHMLVYVQGVSGIYYADDETRFRDIALHFRWAV